MSTKSTTVTKSATAPAAAPAAPPDTAPATQERYSGKINPLSAIMRLTVGKEPSAEESSELAKFISGAIRLTDSHVYAAARFFEKRYHVQLSNLAMKVARYQASQDEELTAQAAMAAIEEMLGIQLATYDGIEGSYSNEYERYRLSQVKEAHETFWNHFGKTGLNIIGEANALDRQSREQRQAEIE